MKPVIYFIIFIQYKLTILRTDRLSGGSFSADTESCGCHFVFTFGIDYRNKVVEMTLPMQIIESLGKKAHVLNHVFKSLFCIAVV